MIRLIHLYRQQKELKAYQLIDKGFKAVNNWNTSALFLLVYRSAKDWKRGVCQLYIGYR